MAVHAAAVNAEEVRLLTETLLKIAHL